MQCKTELKYCLRANFQEIWLLSKFYIKQTIKAVKIKNEIFCSKKDYMAIVHLLFHFFAMPFSSFLVFLFILVGKLFFGQAFFQPSKFPACFHLLRFAQTCFIFNLRRTCKLQKAKKSWIYDGKEIKKCELRSAKKAIEKKLKVISLSYWTKNVRLFIKTSSGIPHFSC